MPTRHRDALSTAAGQLTITKHPHGCLMVFPRDEWEKFRSRIASLPMDAQWWRRIFLGNAMDVDMDGTSRGGSISGLTHIMATTAVDAVRIL